MYECWKSKGRAITEKEAVHEQLCHEGFNPYTNARRCWQSQSIFPSLGAPTRIVAREVQKRKRGLQSLLLPPIAIYLWYDWIW